MIQDNNLPFVNFTIIELITESRGVEDQHLVAYLEKKCEANLKFKSLLDQYREVMEADEEELYKIDSLYFTVLVGLPLIIERKKTKARKASVSNAEYIESLHQLKTSTSNVIKKLYDLKFECSKYFKQMLDLLHEELEELIFDIATAIRMEQENSASIGVREEKPESTHQGRREIIQVHEDVLEDVFKGISQHVDPEQHESLKELLQTGSTSQRINFNSNLNKLAHLYKRLFIVNKLKGATTKTILAQWIARNFSYYDVKNAVWQAISEDAALSVLSKTNYAVKPHNSLCIETIKYIE